MNTRRAVNVMYCVDDLPSDIKLEGDSVAIDTEATGLCHANNRLCLVQISDTYGNVYLIHMKRKHVDCPNFKAILLNSDVQKIFHFARFDVALLQRTLCIFIENIYCTKVASKLVRTFTENHSLKELCSELLGVKISKTQQSSDWGSEILTEDQKQYAASDVIHLHALKNILDKMLIREGRYELSRLCFGAISAIAAVDAMSLVGVFDHH